MSAVPSQDTLPVREKTGDGASGTEPSFAALGKPLLREFLFDPSYRNLNHGSFGAIPRAIQRKLREYQDRAEARPDPFIRYEYPCLLDESRAAVARLLRCPVDTVVFVSNATTGVNVVLRNLDWAADGRDEILHFSTLYGGCGRTIDYVVESRRGRVAARCVDIAYPIEDEEVVARFRAAVATARAAGRRPRVCVFDVVSSMPGVAFPFEAVTAACRDLGVLSLVDGAQGVGMVDLDLGRLDADFFVSNCHKWLHVPRGCAVFQVPRRNQDLIRSSLPTSHGFVAREIHGGGRPNPLPPARHSRFVNAFEFVGTLDVSPYLCVRDSIRWREEVLGGEARILAYQTRLARDGGRRVAEILGTEVLENRAGTLGRCAMTNVALPLTLLPAAGAASEAAARPDRPTVREEDAGAVTHWMSKALVDDYQTFIALTVHQGRWWARLSAQVYLSLEDFEWAGETLKDLCRRVGTLDVTRL